MKTSKSLTGSNKEKKRKIITHLSEALGSQKKKKRVDLKNNQRSRKTSNKIKQKPDHFQKTD